MGSREDVWQIIPIKYIADCNTEVLPEATDKNMPLKYIDIRSVNYGDGIRSIQKFTFAEAPSRARRVVHVGDTIISTVRTYLKAIAYISEEYRETICSTGFAVLTPHDVDAKFFFYALNSDEFVSTVEKNSYGVSYPAITEKVLIGLKLKLPPIGLQRRIAGYLDTKIAHIGNCISQLQSQLSMLTRYKCDLIAKCITKGLDKSAPMKPSGEDWIGDVPEHWNITKLKWMFEIVKRIYGKEDRDVLAITQHGIKRKDMESNKGQYAESYGTYQVVNVNDFAMNSMDLLTGWVDCSRYEGVTSPDYRVFRFYEDKPQCHGYFTYLFQMCYTNRIFYRLGQGVSNLGRWRLQTDQFRNIKLPQPPVEEQERIAAYLDEKIRQIDAAVADITSQIQKLKDYRRILIHDAVMGKIKI